jgi:hypothetical protein
MGRWAQYQKRGGLNGPGGGLPAGPLVTAFTVVYNAPYVQAIWSADGPNMPGYWRSRWRDMQVSDLWSLDVLPPPHQVHLTACNCPLALVAGHFYQVEACYCALDGTPLSQWSGFVQYQYPA